MDIDACSPIRPTEPLCIQPRRLTCSQTLSFRSACARAGCANSDPKIVMARRVIPQNSTRNGTGQFQRFVLMLRPHMSLLRVHAAAQIVVNKWLLAVQSTLLTAVPG